MYMCGRFSAIDQSDDVRVVQTLEDFDFTVKVVFELLVELREVD